MKKLTALVLSVMMIFTSFCVVPAFAGTDGAVTVPSSGLRLEHEDVMGTYYFRDSWAPNASKGTVVQSNWGGSTDPSGRIELTVEKSGYYNFTNILNQYKSGSYSQITTTIYETDGETIIIQYNNHTTLAGGTATDVTDSAAYTGVSKRGAFDRILKLEHKNIYLEAGTIYLDIKVFKNGANYAFFADYCEFTPVILDPMTVTGRKIDKLDTDKWITEELSDNLVTLKDDANAMGGAYGYSEALGFSVVEIPVDVEKTANYDIEYILGQPSTDSYSSWTLYLDDEKIFDSKSSAAAADLSSVSSDFPMKKFKKENISLDEGVHTLKLVINANAEGKRTFAADYIEFIPYAVEGEAYPEIDKFEIKDGVVTVEGRVLNSIGEGYEGISADIYLTLPGSDPIKINEEDIISDTDGMFSLTYELIEDDVKGTCTITVEAQVDVTEPAEKTYDYMSASYLNPILDEFENTSDARGVFDTYRTELGVDDVSDTEALTDADPFYDAFEGKTLASLEEFRTFYTDTLLKEKINQAKSADDVKAIITNDDNVKTLGLDTDKLEALNNDGIEYVAGAIYDLERVEELSDFAEKFEDEIFNDALLSQFGIGTFTLKSDSENVKQGQTTELEIKALSEIDSLKMITLTIAFEDALDGEYSDFELTTELGECVKSEDGDTLIFEITPEEVTTVTDIANISFIPEMVGTGKVAVKGTAVIDNTTDYDAEADIKTTEFTVYVSEQVKQSIGGGSSSGRGSGGISFGGATAVVPSVQPAEQQTTVKTFKDLSTVPWAEEAIVGLYNRQAITMPEDGIFNPNRTITRAEFIKMVILANYMWRGAALENDFNDVSKDDWYYQYLVSAVNNKLITGDYNGNFRPNDPITREDICVILARLKKVKNADMNILFADDGEISEYAKVAVYYMKEAGIVNGVGNDNFAPKANATRAEAAKIIYGTVQ